MRSPDEEPKSSSSSVPGHAKRLKVVCELVRHPRRAAQQAPGGSRRACCGSRDPAAGGQRHLLGSQLHTKQRQPAEHAPVAEEELVLWEGPALARDRMRAPAASPHLGHSGLSASITLAAQPLQQHWCTLHAAACEGGRLHGGGGGGAAPGHSWHCRGSCRTALTAVQEGWVCADMRERYHVGSRQGARLQMQAVQVVAPACCQSSAFERVTTHAGPA